MPEKIAARARMRNFYNNLAHANSIGEVVRDSLEFMMNESEVDRTSFYIGDGQGLKLQKRRHASKWRDVNEEIPESHLNLKIPKDHLLRSGEVQYTSYFTDAPKTEITVPLFSANKIHGAIIFDNEYRVGKKRPHEIPNNNFFKYELDKTGDLLGAIVMANKALTGKEVSDSALEKTQNIASFMAHEMGGPLGNILGCANMLRDKYDLELIEWIENNVNKMSADISTLLNLDRATNNIHEISLDYQPFEGFIKSSLDYMTNQPDWKDKKDRIRYPDEFPKTYVNIDDKAMSIVLDNYLRNSIKYGTGDVTLRFEEDDEQISTFVKSQGNGISDKVKNELFKMHSSFNIGQKKGGWGIGLAASKTIVQVHGGEVGVTSEPGKKGWTEFYFTIPKS